MDHHQLPARLHQELLAHGTSDRAGLLGRPGPVRAGQRCIHAAFLANRPNNIALASVLRMWA